MSEINKEYHNYLMNELLPFEGFSSRPMIGGYIYYYQGKIIGGIYGKGNFFVKITEAAKKYMPDSRPEPPYTGAKEMLPVTIVDNAAKLKEMIINIANELVLPSKKKRQC